MSLLVARIGKPHSLRGEVTVRVHTDDPDHRFAPGAALTTQAAAGSGVPRELTVRTARWHNGVLLLSFDGIPDRTGAESLRGTELLADVEEETADQDGWYEDQLVGLRAVDPAGVHLGEVVGLDVGAAQDRLILRLADGARAHVPFVEALVPVVDTAAGTVVVDAPPGLYDLAREQ